MGLLAGKKVVVLGVANEKSIAWAIARLFHAEGAELLLTYAGEAIEKRVRPLAESIRATVAPCNVTSDEEIATLMSAIDERWGGIDILIHSVAFADKEELKGSILSTTRQGFSMALDISAYSFIALLKEAQPLMAGRNAVALAMSYYGAEKVFPNYNVMGVAKAALEASVRYLAVGMGEDGVRVNAISAGPIKTLAAAGVAGFNQILSTVEERAPLRRNITQEEVAKSALYLCSDLASGVTGEVHYVDAGYHVTGI
ncbi:enoyl-ACP reductase FabI [Trichlorobacter ammonificans]|uniref:Enoyl-[acyl-carrier-protein] reductase [NADH] n=1 Tax=Trichlorobacter ammonificans TaxID=2916410 RepID=A0ABM9D773_9BACT|nr:enoyl-ACP reductase [Trichlorobacter ammonificans]CAH2031009.1 Enoyl-[acyl-carrier-protein] reductase [NADH] 1 [Trichlorobacter ammonificans]